MRALLLHSIRAAIRSRSVLLAIVAAVGVSIAAISLDLFGFDGSPARAGGVAVGTFELACSLAAIGCRLSGPGGPSSAGFQASLRQVLGPTRLEFTASLASGLAPWLVAAIPLITICVFYNYSPEAGAVGVGARAVGVTLGAVVTASWAGLGARIGGRAAGAALGLAALAVGRIDVPAAVRALAASAVPDTEAGLAWRLGTGALVVSGLALATGAMGGRDTPAD